MGRERLLVLGEGDQVHLARFSSSSAAREGGRGALQRKSAGTLLFGNRRRIWGK